MSLEHDAQGRLVPPGRTTVLLPTRRRAPLALLKGSPPTDGGSRTRWSHATLALPLPATRGLMVSAEAMHRWLHAIGWVWKRAKRVAKDDALPRGDRLARLRWGFAQLTREEAMVCADARDIQL